MGTTGEMAMRTLVDQRHRITYYRGVPWGELYDLANDPLELDNLWDDPAAATTKRDMTEAAHSQDDGARRAQPASDTIGVTSRPFAQHNLCGARGVRWPAPR